VGPEGILPATNMPLPAISIVTPSFNQGAFLERTIQSVLTQNYPVLEYLIMDAGSTDRSVPIIKKYSDRLTFWRSHADGGQSEAICDGWKRSTGEVLGWLNSDDYYYPDALRTAGTIFAEHPEILVVWGGIALVDERGNISRTKPAKTLSAVDLLLFKDVPGQPGAFIRRSVYEELGGPRLDLHYVMDWEMWLRILLRYSESSIAIVDRTLAGATQWSGAKTLTAATRDNEEVRRVLQDLFAKPNLNADVRAIEKRAYARTWWRQSKAELQLGRRWRSFRSLARSVQLAPANAGKAFQQSGRIFFQRSS
jgi:glycosyltransferase involved in cell wall biosynthesis